MQFPNINEGQFTFGSKRKDSRQKTFHRCLPDDTNIDSQINYGLTQNESFNFKQWPPANAKKAIQLIYGVNMSLYSTHNFQSEKRVYIF